MKRLPAVFSLIALLTTVACRGGSVSPASLNATMRAGAIPAFDHIFIIVMENHAYGEIIGNAAAAPYINQLAGQYGVATTYFAVSHPSLPNYLALIGADTFGISSDCTRCFVNAPNLVADRIAQSGRSWKAYMEGMPTGCFVGDSSTYAQRHNPFIYFNDIRTKAPCRNVVSFASFAGDLSSSATTANYVWLTPDLCHDMHDCSIGTGDAWLKNTVPAILNSPAYVGQKSLLLITWDEDDSSQNNQVATLVIARSVPAGFKSSIRYDHYSLVKTVEQSWGLTALTANDAHAIAMSDFFGSGDSVSVPDSR